MRDKNIVLFFYMLLSSLTSNIYGRWYLSPMSFDSLFVTNQLVFCFLLFCFPLVGLIYLFVLVLVTGFFFFFFLRLETILSLKITCCICRNQGNADLFPRGHEVTNGHLIAVPEDLIHFLSSCHLCGAHTYMKSHTK